ncbi:MAG: hypothetical protein KJO81_02370, partial [Gammaproteobacteria bacterium]|nr:hypothetical protein [Gammaproteobacteria bacterium]
KDMQSDDVKVRLPARSFAIQLLKNNRIKVNPMLCESMRELTDEVEKSQGWNNIKNVPFLEDS